VTGLHPHAKFHRCGCKNVGLQPPKSQKMVFFWYKFAPKVFIQGVHKKGEYRCTNTNLPASNDTVIVLKTTLLHSVFVITNFVIPKHDRQKNHTFSSTAGAWPTILTILGMVIKKVCAILHSPNFFDPIRNFTARGYLKFEGKCPHCGKVLITWLLVPRKWPH